MTAMTEGNIAIADIPALEPVFLQALIEVECPESTLIRRILKLESDESVVSIKNRHDFDEYTRTYGVDVSRSVVLDNTLRSDRVTGIKACMRHTINYFCACF